MAAQGGQRRGVDGERLVKLPGPLEDEPSLGEHAGPVHTAQVRRRVFRILQCGLCLPLRQQHESPAHLRLRRGNGQPSGGRDAHGGAKLSQRGVEISQLPRGQAPGPVGGRLGRLIAILARQLDRAPGM